MDFSNFLWIFVISDRIFMILTGILNRSVSSAFNSGPRLVKYTKQMDFCRPRWLRGPGHKVQGGFEEGARRVQGGCREGAGRVQGGFRPDRSAGGGPL